MTLLSLPWGLRHEKKCIRAWFSRPQSMPSTLGLIMFSTCIIITNAWNFNFKPKDTSMM